MGSSWLLAALLWSQVDVNTGDTTFKRIDDAWERGVIRQEERLFYRVASVRAPHLVPAEWRAPWNGKVTAGCVTPVMVEAFQAMRTMTGEWKDKMGRLLAPPEPLPYVIETRDPFPITVSYADPIHATKAQQVLHAAVTAYQKEVLEWGFWAPPLEEEHGYSFSIQSAEGAAGYTAPYAAVESTDRSDAYSFIVIDPSLDPVAQATTVAHEFNHACQVGMDVEESVAFMENTATWVESQVFPEGWSDTVHMFRYFQTQPHKPLEWMKAGGSDGYEYGGSLWVHFLEQRFGEMVPRWIRQVWEGSVQSSTVNEPDYQDALDRMLADRGGLRAAVVGFALDRYFVGSEADGQHLPGAEEWRGAEVARADRIASIDLPVVDRYPPNRESNPQPNGCNYVVYVPDANATLPVRLSFRGQVDLQWHVEVVTRTRQGTATIVPMELDEEDKGIMKVEQAGVARVVMVVCHLAGPDHDPDNRNWPVGFYRYSVVLDVPPPVITEVIPTVLSRGAFNEPLTIRGAHLGNRDGMNVQTSGQGVSLRLDQVVSDSELKVCAFVSPDAELGARDIIIGRPTGDHGVGSGLLTISVPSPPDAGVQPVPGVQDADQNAPDNQPACGCQHVNRDESLWALLGLGLAWMGISNRRRAP